jgi:hypothetical protein
MLFTLFIYAVIDLGQSSRGSLCDRTVPISGTIASMDPEYNDNGTRYRTSNNFLSLDGLLAPTLNLPTYHVEPTHRTQLALRSSAETHPSQ